MIEETVKTKPVVAETPQKEFVIHEGQAFKIQILLNDETLRDEFTGADPKLFKDTFEFAKKICRIYKGAKLVVSIKTRHK